MNRLALLLLLASVAQAADERLAAIRTLLVPMRTAPVTSARGATPALTEVKHEFRDWIESRLGQLKWTGHRWDPDPKVLQEQLNDELRRAGLLCEEDQRCSEDWLGFLNGVALEIQSGFLVIRTSVGVQICGDDDSAYIYERTENHWRRIWQSEQDNYAGKAYSPQRLVDVKISPTNSFPGSDRNEHLIVTTGVFPWCTSVWQPVYYRVWRTRSAYFEPLLLLDESEDADIASPIHTRVSQNDVFFQYSVIGDDANRVPQLRHYVLEEGDLRRTDPVALTPADFVSFWLRSPWSEASEWTDPARRATLEAWRQSYKGRNSEFALPSRRCTRQTDLWQVATGYGIGLPPEPHYFLIRVRPPYRFTMVAASDHPWPDCTEEDPAIDRALELFDR